jgi:hypothetical protein
MSMADVKKAIQQRAEGASPKVKEAIPLMLHKIDAAGEAAGIWLEQLEAHFDKLIPEDAFEGWDMQDFAELHKVLYGYGHESAPKKVAARFIRLVLAAAKTPPFKIEKATSSFERIDEWVDTVIRVTLTSVADEPDEDVVEQWVKDNWWDVKHAVPARKAPKDTRDNDPDLRDSPRGGESWVSPQDMSLSKAEISINVNGHKVDVEIREAHR